MAAEPKFLPNVQVKVTRGSFAGRIGTVLDQQNAVDGRGAPLSPTRPGSGYYWVMLSLGGGHPFAAHLHEDELEELV
jgi:hypothetical protein